MQSEQPNLLCLLCDGDSVQLVLAVGSSQEIVWSMKVGAQSHVNHWAQVRAEAGKVVIKCPFPAPYIFYSSAGRGFEFTPIPFPVGIDPPSVEQCKIHSGNVLTITQGSILWTWRETEASWIRSALPGELTLGGVSVAKDGRVWLVGRRHRDSLPSLYIQSFDRIWELADFNLSRTAARMFAKHGGDACLCTIDCEDEPTVITVPYYSFWDQLLFSDFPSSEGAVVKDGISWRAKRIDGECRFIFRQRTNQISIVTSKGKRIRTSFTVSSA